MSRFYVLFLALAASQLAAAPPALAAWHDVPKVCEVGYVNEFHCEQGKEGAFDEEKANRDETEFCKNLSINAQKTVEDASAQYKTASKDFWQSEEGKQLIQQSQDMCVTFRTRKIKGLRNSFCAIMAPKCEPGAGKWKKKGSCDSSAQDCLKQAADEQNNGLSELGQTKGDLESTISGAGQALSDLMTAAVSYMEKRGQSVGGPGEPGYDAFARDQQLLARSIEAVSNPTGFQTMLEASAQTEDQALQQSLAMSGGLKSLDEAAKIGLADVADAQGALGGMAGTTLDRANKLGAIDSTLTGLGAESLKEAGGTRKISRPDSPDSSGAASKGADGTSMITTASRDQKNGSSSIDGASPKAAAEGGQAAVAAQKPGAGRESLRALLAKSLRNGEDGSAKEAGAAEAKGKPLDGDAVLAQSSFVKAKGHLDSDKSADLGGRDFRAISTDKALEQYLGAGVEPGRHLASSGEEGVLPKDSDSLFVRVHEAHRSSQLKNRI